MRPTQARTAFYRTTYRMDLLKLLLKLLNPAEQHWQIPACEEAGSISSPSKSAGVHWR